MHRLQTVQLYKFVHFYEFQMKNVNFFILKKLVLRKFSSDLQLFSLEINIYYLLVVIFLNLFSPFSRIIAHFPIIIIRISASYFPLSSSQIAIFVLNARKKPAHR